MLDVKLDALEKKVIDAMNIKLDAIERRLLVALESGRLNSDPMSSANFRPHIDAVQTRLQKVVRKLKF